MPPVCQTCRHDKRAAIDAALVRGTSSRAIARQYGIERTSLDRHRPHAAASIVRAAARAGERFDDSLLGQVRSLQARTLSLLDDAEAARDGRLRAVAIAQVRENVQLLAKLTGELNEAPQVAVVLAWASEGVGAQGQAISAAGGTGAPAARQNIETAVKP